ncbi:MAG: hypothetical protein J6L69_00955 [Lachnospiraceae bacterium]|nr:hypothetical protein [Lachnospiraceae bacterium]
MINFLKRFIPARSEELMFFPLISTILFVIGHAILWLVMIFDKSADATSFEMGTTLALMSLLFNALFGASSYSSSFNYALSMSQTRTRIISGLLVVSFIKGSVIITLTALFNLIESNVCKKIFSDVPMESNLSVIFKPHYMLLIVLIYVAFEAFLGAIYTKFGATAFAVLWVGTILFLQVPVKIIDKLAEKNPNYMARIFEALSKMNGKLLYFSVLAVLILLTLLPYALLKKQRVTL